MNRFIIVDGLPFLLAHGKVYAVCLHQVGFTLGAEVNLASVPRVTYSETSIRAKCAAHPDSISQQQEQQEQPLDGMTVAKLKAYAEAHGIDLGKAKKKAEILAAIEAAQDVSTNDSNR